MKDDRDASPKCYYKPMLPWKQDQQNNTLIKVCGQSACGKEVLNVWNVRLTEMSRDFQIDKIVHASMI